MGKKVLSFTAVVMALLGLFCSAGGPAHAQKLEKVRLAYSSNVPGSDSTFLFAGKQLGLFEQQGIDLEIQPTGGTVASAGLIASGAMDIALGGLEAMPGYVEKGVPLRAVYVYTYRPIFQLGFLKGSKVQSVPDLRNAKVGVLSLSSGSIPVLEYILREAGMSIKDVQLIPVGLGPSALAAIKSGAVDALMYHDTAYTAFAANGVEYTLYSSPRLEKGYVGQGIYALDTTLKERPQVVTAFLRALTMSLVYATNDPAGATKAFGLLQPEIAKNPSLEEALWRDRMKISEPPPQAKGEWGYMDADAWNNFLDVLLLGKLITKKPPLDSLYTTQFLAAANTFDRSKLPK